MSDIKLAIKIPEEVRLALINNIPLSMDQQSICDSYIKHAIINGTPLEELEQEPTYCPKFRNQQEKHRVFHTVTAVEKFFSVIGNDDAIDDISILKELVRKMEVMEE